MVARNERPTVLSAFTGAGGLDLGLERAGFRTVAAIELDPSARETIKLNRPDWGLVEERNIVAAAKKLRPATLNLKVRELGLLVGGPPCQPFSKAAQWADRGRAGLRDPRAKCLSAFLDLLEAFLPRAMVIENVPGFVRGKTSAIPSLKKALDGINDRHGTKYSLQYRTLNAVNYGVPQRRFRAILVALRDGSDFEWPGETHAAPVRAYDALRGIRPRDLPAASGYWSDLLPSIPEGQNYLFHTESNRGKPLFGRRRWFWSFLLKLAKDQPSWTIPAKPGPSTGPFHWDNRPLAIEELLRLQTFPLSWKLHGGAGARVRQVGNATPPLLAEVIGRALGTQLFSLRYDGSPTLCIPRSRTVPRRRRRTSVPKKYFRHLNHQDEHPGEGRGPGAKRRKRRLQRKRRAQRLVAAKRVVRRSWR
jgi:DNA (cytosine-5)-methyltransferase 1